MTTSNTSPSATKSPLDWIRSFVHQEAAIVLEDSKKYLVESRLKPVMVQHGISSMQELVNHLMPRSNRMLIQHVIEAMATHESSFFRDGRPFEVLAKTILPELMASRQSSRELHCWSNACSAGQEPYSLAILLEEHFSSLKNWRFRIVASDISNAILQKAKLGVFNGVEVHRGLNSDLLKKYFRPFGNDFQIIPEIRRMVQFQTINLIDSWPAILGKMDVIFLRNVLIYFSPKTKTDILRRLTKVLHPNGYLFLGAGESILNLDVPLERVQYDGVTCYRLPR